VRLFVRFNPASGLPDAEVNVMPTLYKTDPVIITLNALG